MIGLLCPGQGSQFVGMGADLVDAFPTARRTFEEADDVLGFSLSDLCREGPEADLTLTINAQPAILVHSVAAWRVLRERTSVEVGMGAGHSLGEFSAYVAADALSFADAVRIVRRRGELMYRSGTERPGTMAAIIGLKDEDASTLCERASEASGATVVPANFNSPGQLVISGDVKAVREAEGIATELGAKRVIPLNVSGAFHSPLMAVAAPGLQEALDAAPMRDPAFPIVSNVTAGPVSGAATARELLIEQLTSPVRWVESMETMRAAGISEFIEIGPGSVLSGLLKRIDRAATSRTLGTREEVEAFTGNGEA